MKKFLCWYSLIVFLSLTVHAQGTSDIPWIRPTDEKSPAVWGIRNGIVVGLWPSAIENLKQGSNGGPRGLLRIGYELNGLIYHINYIAIEPVVNGKMEFSEISPSAVDQKWGKFMWTGDSIDKGNTYRPAITRGTISTTDSGTGVLSFYVFMEKFNNGARPYLKLSIRSDKPEELGIEIFHHDDSAPMERCGITATMGNYSRLRKLHLKNTVINARELYKGYNSIDFIEKKPYGAGEMLHNKAGDLIVIAETDETFAELASWPQEADYFARWNWRYRPFYVLRQYWRKEHTRFDPGLQIRVNGRAKYWSGGTRDATRYINIPHGPSFENFELREPYYPGQRFYFGMSRKTVQQLIKEP